MPTRDLCADLRNQRDNDLCDSENVCTATNRQLRLYVAGWMLARDDSPAFLSIGVNDARDLYEGCGRDLLNKPGHLTTAVIAGEILQMCEQAEVAQ